MNKLLEDITKAASDPELCDAVAGVYREVDEQVGQLEVVCRGCGKCCRFEEFGEDLLASTAEMGYFWAWLRKQPAMLSRLLAGKGELGCKVCPFLEDESCAAREARVLGCRAFFCGAKGVKKEQMGNMYEAYHERIGELHRQRGVRYQYLGWGEAILAMGELARGARRAANK